MVEFAGWHMPLWFTSIIKEHLAVRNAVGIFDVTHMGRMLITGKDSCSLLQYVTTNNVEKLKVNRLHYSMVCNPFGGIKDDVMILRLEEEKYLLICNASNREKIFDWLNLHAQNYEVKVENVSDEVPMFALQGPLAEKTLQKLVEAAVEGASDPLVGVAENVIVGQQIPMGTGLVEVYMSMPEKVGRRREG